MSNPHPTDGRKNLNRGNPGNKGGGRTPDWLKAKCQRIIDKKKLVEFLADVAEGKDFEQGVGQEGEVIKIPCSIKDRIRATELLIERGFGKAPQALEVAGKDGGPIIFRPINYAEVKLETD